MNNSFVIRALAIVAMASIAKDSFYKASCSSWSRGNHMTAPFNPKKKKSKRKHK